MYYIGQACGIIATVCCLLLPLFKQKWQMLLMNGLANIFYAKGCTKINKLETSLILTVEPVFNPVPVLLVTGEMPGPLAIAGFIVVIGGITLYGLLPAISERKLKNKGINAA